MQQHDSSTTAAAATSSSTSSRQQAAAGSSRQQQAAAGSSRQQQASVGSSRHKQTQADAAAVSATAGVQQLAASQQLATTTIIFVGDFRRDVPASGNAYFGFRSSFRAMVFPRPAGLCLCGHSSSSRCRLSLAWGFLAGSCEGSASSSSSSSNRIFV